MIFRLRFLGGTVALGIVAFVSGALAPVGARANGQWLSFTPVATNDLDTITVPEGFNWHPVASWGDPLWSRGTAFDHGTRGTGASQEKAGTSRYRPGDRLLQFLNAL